MWRVFLDANILFSASYLEDSALRRLWELEDVTLITSCYAIQEARRNLTATQQIADLTRLLVNVEAVEITDEAPNQNPVAIEKHRLFHRSRLFSHDELNLRPKRPVKGKPKEIPDHQAAKHCPDRQADKKGRRLPGPRRMKALIDLGNLGGFGIEFRLFANDLQTAQPQPRQPFSWPVLMAE